MQKNYFILKVFISFLLFCGFCFMKREDRVIGEYDSSDIQKMIMEDMKPDEIYDIQVFHHLKDML